MKLYTLNINDTELRIAVVTDKEEMKKGLSGSKKLKKGYGMLFDFKEEQEVTMNMGDMNYPIDMVFIKDPFEIFKVETMSTDSKDITVKNTRFVLEVNAGEAEGFVGGKEKFCDSLNDVITLNEKKEEEKETESGVNIIIKIQTVPDNVKRKFKTGGKLNMFEEDVAADYSKMQVLDDSGRVLMNIKGGERIFSILHTDKLVDLAENGDVEELGKTMAKIIDIQDTQEKEYV